MSGTLSPWPVVQNGTQGSPIGTLQFLLAPQQLHFPIDGMFGPGTEAAVKAFQAGKGMTADGIMNPQTWSVLIIQVKKGSHGVAVRGAQEEFQFRAGEPGKGLKVDGIFGPQTDSTVRGFQHALSLDIPSVILDGIVGPVTWQAL